ncbi:hypothetical protein GCM10010977_08900 [Citricoccus zhacaiensis]|uniref:Uncharacterized protein n=1 Tax=Citricoccus zhacaiensis TaxID=489142 RepID=A0ABQ2LSI0_9MICC|nr:hypothetical protein GCM10010977_08900 [Citricoccus zhacaiensis]
MAGSLAVFGSPLGLLDQIASDLQTLGVRVLRSRHPHGGLPFPRVLLGAAFQWRRGWLANGLSRWKLRRAIANIEPVIAQNGMVLVLVQLIGVPATRLEAVLDRLSEIAEDATARVTNLQGRDATINILAFDNTSQRPAIRTTVLDYLKSGGRITTGECVHHRELDGRSLHDALTNRVL